MLWATLHHSCKPILQALEMYMADQIQLNCVSDYILRRPDLVYSPEQI